MAKKTTPRQTSRARSKTGKAEAPTPQTVRITYDLFDLPSAQHKAGLAGLVLHVRSMDARRILSQNCVIESMTPTSVTFTFSEKLIQAVFDDLYSAALIESEPAEKPRKKKDPTLGKHGVPDGRIPGKCKGCYQRKRINRFGRCKTCWSRESAECVDSTDLRWTAMQAGGGCLDDFDNLNEEE